MNNDILISVRGVRKVYEKDAGRIEWRWWVYVILGVLSPFIIPGVILLVRVIINLVRKAKKSNRERKIDGVEVLRNVGFDVAKGEIFAIVGDSGSGKTTLLNMLGGVDTVTEGEILIDGNAIHSMTERALAAFRNKRLGYVFQFNNLLTEFNAIENVMLPSLMTRYDKKKARAKAEALLTRVGLKDRMHHKIGELSGGEQQRVAIARALVNDPAVILADEPTGNLDFATAEEVRTMLWDIVRERHMTLVVVTHSPMIFDHADRVMLVSLGTASIVEPHA